MTPKIQNNIPSVIQFTSATVSSLPEAQRQFIAAEAKARLDTTLAHLCLDSRAIHDCDGNPLSKDICSSIASGMRNDLEVIIRLTSPHGQDSSALSGRWYCAHAAQLRHITDALQGHDLTDIQRAVTSLTTHSTDLMDKLKEKRSFSIPVAEQLVTLYANHGGASNSQLFPRFELCLYSLPSKFIDANAGSSAIARSGEAGAATGHSLGDGSLGFANLNRPHEQKLLAADQHFASLLADPLDQDARSAAVNSLSQLKPEETLSCVTSAISKFRQQEDGSGPLARVTGRKIFEFLTTVYESIPYPDANNFRTRNNQSQTWQSASYPLKHQLAVLRAEHALELPPDLCRNLRASLREALCGPKLQRTDPKTRDITIIDSMCQIDDCGWVDTVSKKIREHIKEDTNTETLTPTWLMQDKQWLQELHSQHFFGDLKDDHYSVTGPFYRARQLARLLIAIDPTLSEASVDDVHRSALAKLPDSGLMRQCTRALCAYYVRRYETYQDATAPHNDYPFNLVLEVCNERLPMMVKRFLDDTPDAVRAYYYDSGITDRHKLRRLSAETVIKDMREGTHTRLKERDSKGIEGVGRRLYCLWHSVSEGNSPSK